MKPVSNLYILNKTKMRDLKGVRGSNFRVVDIFYVLFVPLRCMAKHVFYLNT